MKKNESKFTPELKAAIEKDIITCEETLLTPAKTHSVYNYMKAKYLPLYPHICDGIACVAKVPSSVWVEELRMFKGALEGIVMNKTEPQQGSQQALNINIGKLKNNGNIGTGNQLSKSTEVGLEVTMPNLPQVKLLKRRD